MVDPLTAMGLATAAYKGIKTAIGAGKDIQDMAGTIGQWSRAVSDLNYSHEKAKNPPFFKKLFGASKIQQDALEIWAQKQKADEMRKELRSYISLYYGPSAWDEIVRIEGQMRKEQREAEYSRLERIETIKEWSIGILLMIVGTAVIGFTIWIIGAGTGRW
tara:strand:- start:139 stop:621 length:483 start_codon:yes stop_codon:yes gene_type:complete